MSFFKWDTEVLFVLFVAKYSTVRVITNTYESTKHRLSFRYPKSYLDLSLGS